MDETSSEIMTILTVVILTFIITIIWLRAKARKNKKN
jgi:hypothetical protein